MYQIAWTNFWLRLFEKKFTPMEHLRQIVKTGQVLYRSELFLD